MRRHLSLCERDYVEPIPPTPRASLRQVKGQETNDCSLRQEIAQRGPGRGGGLLRQALQLFQQYVIKKKRNHTPKTRLNQHININQHAYEIHIKREAFQSEQRVF